MLNSVPVSRRRLMSIGAGLMAGAALPPAAFARTELKGATFVLVHGAWHGGWCWRRVSDLIPAGNKQQITLRLDADVIQFFRGTGRRYQSRINAALRDYVNAQKKAV